MRVQLFQMKSSTLELPASHFQKPEPQLCQTISQDFSILGAIGRFLPKHRGTSFVIALHLEPQSLDHNIDEISDQSSLSIDCCCAVNHHETACTEIPICKNCSGAVGTFVNASTSVIASLIFDTALLIRIKIKFLKPTSINISETSW